MMRLGEFLESTVVDRDGEEVGQVHDARLVRDGPVQGVFGPAYRVQGLVVGVASIGVRLGFDRGDLKGPALLKALFRRVHRDARFVPWEQIEGIREGRIRLTVAGSELSPVPPLGG